MRNLIGLFLVCLMLAPSIVHGKVLELSAADAYPYSTPEGDGVADRIVREAFRRAGLAVRVLYAPSERSLVNANEGIVDGEFLRIAGLEQKYPNLMMVPEAICEYHFTAFARDHGIRLKGWESLRPYNVGYITGWKILEKNVTGVKSVTSVRNEEALFELLRSGRADLVIYERLLGEALLRRIGEKEIRPLSPPLARREMYLYLNRRHESLIPLVAKAFRQMKQDGTWQRIMASVPGSGK